MVVIILNWVFDGDNVCFVTLLIDNVNHRGERGRFAGTGRTGHQNQSARFIKQFLCTRRNADLFHRKQFGGELPEYYAKITPFLEHTDAEARHITKRETKVRTAMLAGALNALLGCDAAHQLLGVFRLEWRPFDSV